MSDHISYDEFADMVGNLREHKDDENVKDLLRRLFELMPPDWKTKFKVGDKVRMAREGWFHKVPLGTVGVVVDDPENVMAMKGQK